MDSLSTSQWLVNSLLGTMHCRMRLVYVHDVRMLQRDSNSRLDLLGTRLEIINRAGLSLGTRARLRTEDQIKCKQIEISPFQSQQDILRNVLSLASSYMDLLRITRKLYILRILYQFRGLQPYVHVLADFSEA